MVPSDEWGWGVLWIPRDRMQLIISEEETKRAETVHQISAEVASTFRGLRDYVQNMALALQEGGEEEGSEEAKVSSPLPEEEGSSDSSRSAKSEGAESTPPTKVHRPTEEEEEMKGMEIEPDSEAVVIQTTKSYMHIIEPRLDTAGTRRMKLRRRVDLLMYGAGAELNHEIAATILNSRY